MIKDPPTLARIKALVMAPAWEDVWICVDPQGHIQPIGTDAAGRRQYRYHDLWREQRDQASCTTGSGSSGLPCRASARSSAVTWKAGA